MNGPSQKINYKKTVPEILIDLFKVNLSKGTFRTFREGDPLIFPASMLPALFISEPKTSYAQGPTGYDEITHNILIQVVFDKKTEFGAPAGVATLAQTIELTMQGRHPTTGVLMLSTVMGILRTNLSIGDLMIEQIGDVEKGYIPRSEELETEEAHVRLTLSELQSVPNRS